MLQGKLDLYHESLCGKIVSKLKFELRTFTGYLRVFCFFGFFLIDYYREFYILCFFPELWKLKIDILMVLLRYNWYTKKCTYFMYTNRSFWTYTNPSWNHYYIPITSKSFLVPLRVFGCFVVRTLTRRSTLLTNFSGHTTVVLTIGTMMLYRSPKLILHNWNYAHWTAPHFSLPTVLGKHHSTLCFYEFDYFRYFT